MKNRMLPVTLIRTFLLLLLVLLHNLNCLAQNTCEERLNLINELYREGKWSSCKDAAIDFINDFPFKDANFTITKSAGGQVYSIYCQTNTSQIYKQLIKSSLRLYDLRTAQYYYKDAQLKEIKVDFDPNDTDRQLMQQSGRLKKNSVSAYFGFVSPNLKNFSLLGEFKIGAFYGVGKNAYVEMSYTKRSITHKSDKRSGAFGRALRNDPGRLPGYSFAFNGNDRFIDLVILNKFPVYRQKTDLNYLYWTAGAYVSYHLNSYVNGYEIIINNATRSDTVRPKNKADRHLAVESSAIKMDLKRLYKERFNYGVLVSYGSNTRLRNRWDMFAELRLTVGRNFSYKQEDFRNFKVGVNYFAIVVGLTKGFDRFKVNNAFLD